LYLKINLRGGDIRISLEKNKKILELLTYYVVVIFVNNRNTRPGVQREGKLGDNHSAMLLS
jgi:hypothetical protein